MFNCPRRVESGKLPENNLDYRTEDGICSYCGSLVEEKFFEYVDDSGYEITPTDKDYKAYVWTPYGLKKFYFQHLSTDGKARFISLLNKSALNIGHPGKFYVLPFFVGFD